MGHAESPSLIPLGLAADVSQEGSSFRWGIIASGFLHVLIVVMALFLRFQSTIEEPFRTMDVALVSLPETQTDSTSKEKASPPAPSPAKVQPASPPKAQTREDSLPPLPTQSASERLSEFLGGAIGSIVVPHKQEMASQTPVPQITDPNPSKERSPLIENLQLPHTAPKLSRAERLFPTEPVIIPKSELPPPTETPQPIRVPLETKVPITPPQPEKVEQAVRPAPALPDLSEVTPFRRTEEEKRPNDAVTPSNLEESLRRTIPTLPTPTPAPKKIQRRTKPIRQEPEKSSLPEMSAPQLEQIRPSQPFQLLEKPVQREKMSEIMEKLRGEVKVPNLNQLPDTPLFQQPMPSSSPSTKPARSEFDERIARLSIPNITSIESIKNRLQLLEVQPTSNSGNVASQPSAGTNHYFGMIQDLIQDQWRNTPLVADAPVVVLKFRIARSGEISQIRTDKSSGNGYYDSAARRAVNAVNPLPPFPPEISDSYLDVRFQFIKTGQKN